MTPEKIVFYSDYLADCRAKGIDPLKPDQFVEAKAKALEEPTLSELAKRVADLESWRQSIQDDGR